MYCAVGRYAARQRRESIVPADSIADDCDDEAPRVMARMLCAFRTPTGPADDDVANEAATRPSPLLATRARFALADNTVDDAAARQLCLHRASTAPATDDATDDADDAADAPPLGRHRGPSADDAAAAPPLGAHRAPADAAAAPWLGAHRAPTDAAAAPPLGAHGAPADDDAAEAADIADDAPPWGQYMLYP